MYLTLLSVVTTICRFMHDNAGYYKQGTCTATTSANNQVCTVRRVFQLWNTENPTNLQADRKYHHSNWQPFTGCPQDILELTPTDEQILDAQRKQDIQLALDWIIRHGYERGCGAEEQNALPNLKSLRLASSGYRERKQREWWDGFSLFPC